MTKRLLGPTVALLVMVLSFALPREASARGEPSERPPAPGSRQYAQEKGPQLLAAERWAEAAEVYAFWDYDLDRAVQFAREQPPGKGEAEQDGYRFRLLNFYFAQADFSRVGWSSSAATIADCGEKYRELVQRTVPPAGAAVLDFSHLDLLKDTSKRTREGNAHGAGQGGHLGGSQGETRIHPGRGLPHHLPGGPQLRGQGCLARGERRPEGPLGQTRPRPADQCAERPVRRGHGRRHPARRCGTHLVPRAEGVPALVAGLVPAAPGERGERREG